MKLQTPLTDRHRAQLTGLHAMLLAWPATLREGSEAFHQARRQATACETKLADLRASADASEEKAAQLNTLQTQAALLAIGQEDALTAYRQVHAEAEEAVRKAARWTGQVCQPLLTQYQEELTRALAPFYAQPGTSAQAHFGSTDAFTALKGFLNEGTALAARNFGTKELLAELARWTATVAALLDGGEIWTFNPGALAAA